MERILLVQLSDIGDLIVTTPAFAALREAKPDAHLTLLCNTTCVSVVAGTGLVDDLIPFDKHLLDSPSALLRPSNLRLGLALAWRLRRGRFDTIVFFHHLMTRLGVLKYAALAFAAGSRQRIGLDNGSGFFLTDSVPDEGYGAHHQAEYALSLVGLLGAEGSPRQAVIARDDSLSPLPDKRPRIAVHAGSGNFNVARRWEPERFAAVADALHDELNAHIVLVGSATDDVDRLKAALRTDDVTDLHGQTTIPQLASVLAHCDLFVGSDSGVMHVAAAVGTPVVALFGPTNVDAWGPWTPRGRAAAISSGPECSPCGYVGQGIGLLHGCEARTCMRMIAAAQVLSAARALLRGDEPPRRLQHRRYPQFERRIRILDRPVDAITYDEWLALIDAWIHDPNADRPRHVCTINPEFIMIARDDPNFSHILDRADLCVPDGVGLLWAAKRLGSPLLERVTGSDGVPKIAARAAERGWRLFFLGAGPAVAERAAEVLRARHPGLQIVDIYTGSPAVVEEDVIVERINASGADILFVAYGAPAQDAWIARNLPRLRVRMAMGVGGSFDFIAGIVPRAPQWMQRLGLEWLYRLYLQPWRIGRMMRLPRFVLAVLREGHPNNSL